MADFYFQIGDFKQAQVQFDNLKREIQNRNTKFYGCILESLVWCDIILLDGSSMLKDDDKLLESAFGLFQDSGYLQARVLLVALNVAIKQKNFFTIGNILSKIHTDSMEIRAAVTFESAAMDCCRIYERKSGLIFALAAEKYKIAGFVRATMYRMTSTNNFFLF